VDFNSSIPCGRFIKKSFHNLPKEVSIENDSILPCYYLFVLYEPLDTLQVQGIALVLADGDYLNSDLKLAESHRNVSEAGFGSYGDAFIRTRKMYRFPNPLADPDFRYRTVLITSDDHLNDIGQLHLLTTKKKLEIRTGIERTFYTYVVV
jgi:hypothetical protein